MNSTNRKAYTICVALLIGSAVTLGLVYGASMFLNVNFSGPVVNAAGSQIIIGSNSYNIDGSSIDINWGEALTPGEHSIDYTIVNTGGKVLTVTMTITESTSTGYDIENSLPSPTTLPTGNAIDGTLTLTIPADAVDGTTVTHVFVVTCSYT